MVSAGHSSGGIYHEIEGRGDPVLLIPGWGGSVQELSAVRGVLAQHYRVIAADPPGSGKSSPQPRRYTASYVQDDAQAFIELLRDLRAPQAHVVGYSDGGEYALVMAQIRPAAVRSIVAWGAAGQFVPAPELLRAWAEMVDKPIPPLREFSRYLVNTYGEGNARLMVETHATALGAIAEAGGDVSRGHAGMIGCPALLMTGEKDFMAPPALVADMAQAMQRAEFMEVADAGHAVHRDRPDWLAETIIAWLANH